ncbi:MAG: hypothetical protein IKP00_04475 [Victivallales bacterium]|nr:hypothetical protein [Victivallales bacterium]
MSSIIYHILLTLCYVFAWLLPLVHEHEVEIERAEHRLCIAEYSHDGGTDAASIHGKCQHQHHDDDHCVICQAGQSVKNGVDLTQLPVIPAPPVIAAATSERQINPVCQIHRHTIQPRAP